MDQATFMNTDVFFEENYFEKWLIRAVYLMQFVI